MDNSRTTILIYDLISHILAFLVFTFCLFYDSIPICTSLICVFGIFSIISYFLMQARFLTACVADNTSADILKHLCNIFSYTVYSLLILLLIGTVWRLLLV